MAITLVCVGLASWSLERIKTQTEKDLSATLKTTLNMANEALGIWYDERKADSITWAASESLVAASKKQLMVPPIREALLSSPALAELDAILEPTMTKHLYLGYTVLNTDGVTIASRYKTNIGKPSPVMEQSDVYTKALHGEFAISRPFISEIPLARNGEFIVDEPSMLTVAPVFDEAGKVIAMFCLRIDPSWNFSRIMQLGRMGNTGETYAFDKNGKLITESRFDHHLRSAGIASKEKRGILSIDIRDPGGDTTRGFAPKIPRDQQPLTYVAADAIAGTSGVNVKGYRDYRGVPVVGAWTWNYDLQVGITTEIDWDEAYLSYIHSRNTILFAFSAAILLLLSIVAVLNRSRERTSALANEVIAEKAHLKTLVENVVDGIITIDEHGIIASFNPAAERIFGYAAGEIVGKNVKTLMPEPYQSEHDEYISRYLQTGKTRVIGMTRELSGVRNNGEVFPLGLSVSEAPTQNSHRTFIGTVRDITEQKNAESQLKRLSLAIEQSPTSILITDMRGKIEYANPNFLETTGYAWAEIAGKTPSILKSGEHPPEFYKNLWDTLLSGNSWTGDFCNRKKSGDLYWELQTISPIKDSQGKITHFVSVKIDDTERRRAEKALLESEERLRSIIDNTTTVIYIKDVQGRYRLINRRFEQLFQITSKQIQGKTDYDIFPRETADGFTANDKRVREKGSLMEMEETVPHADGAHTYISIKVPLHDSNGKIYAICGLSTDITERKQIENSLLQTNRFLKSILDSPSDISIVSTDLKGNILFWNKGAEKMLGYDAVEMIGRKTDLLYPDEVARRTAREAIAFILKNKRGVSGEVQEIRKNGEKIWVKLTLSPKLDESGESIGILGVGENITQRKEAEAALRASEEKSRMIIDTASEAFISIDENDLISNWNKKAEEIFGWTRDEALGEAITDLIIPAKYIDAHKRGIERFRTTKEAPVLNRRIEITALRRGGHEFPIELSISSLLHKGAYTFNAFITDITQRKLAQIEQAHTQKMESIGQLSAGIAHEINTPMQYIGDNIHFLDSSFKDLLKTLNEYDKLLQAGKQGAIPPELIESVETAAQQADLPYLVEEIPLAINQSQEGIGRVTKIVGAMKEFSHPGAEEKKLVDVNRAIETTVTVARNEWKYVANVVTDLAPDLPMVPALVNDIHQVILNLIVNAAHAIADVVGKNEETKGTIKISTRHNGTWVEIRVQDTGTGIPPEIRPRIFDPFFTTKDVGKGTGQGLSLCHAMITKKHNGAISFETEVGKGTTFIVRLPTASTEPK